MPKICSVYQCNYPVFGKGFCKIHQYKRTDKKITVKKKNRIPFFSEKKLNELATYRPVRDEYMKEHQYCEVHDCNKRSTNLHHKKGRIGFADSWAKINNIKLLWDIRYFMACCETCHPQRIHENPDWARKNKYLL